MSEELPPLDGGGRRADEVLRGAEERDALQLAMGTVPSRKRKVDPEAQVLAKIDYAVAVDHARIERSLVSLQADFVELLRRIRSLEEGQAELRSALMTLSDE